MKYTILPSIGCEYRKCTILGILAIEYLELLVPGIRCLTKRSFEHTGNNWFLYGTPKSKPPPPSSWSVIGSIVHTEISFRFFFKTNWNQIIYTIFRLIWNQMDVRLGPNQSENGIYNLISIDLRRISCRFPCVYSERKSISRKEILERKSWKGNPKKYNHISIYLRRISSQFPCK